MRWLLVWGRLRLLVRLLMRRLPGLLVWRLLRLLVRLRRVHRLLIDKLRRRGVVWNGCWLFVIIAY